ncbi:MAG: DUF2974 domain-containing protein [Ruthenibacterium sp.]
MNNLIAYVENTMETMCEKPFNQVDSLVLAQFCYTHLNGLAPTPEDAVPPMPLKNLLKAEHFKAMFQGLLAPDSNQKLLMALAASPRYREIGLHEYVDLHNDSTIEQFAAMTFFLPDDTLYIAFRGTDTSFLGWKEDFNMAYVCPVPSQTASLVYLRGVAQKHAEKPLRLGGHSKGGNLAVYAAMTVENIVKDQIKAVYSHDGPGFQQEMLAGSNFAAVQTRIQKTLPQSSLIGMLLQSNEPYRVVKSAKIGGLLQHDPFSWEVQDGDFVYLPKLTDSAVYRNTTLDAWLATLTEEKRSTLIAALFQIIDASGATTFADFAANWQKDIPAMLKALTQIDKETRDDVTEVLKELVKISLKNLTNERT